MDLSVEDKGGRGGGDLSPPVCRLWLLAICGLALAVRLYRLDRLSFWFDEGVSADLSTFADSSLWHADVHPPLYYALLATWRQFGGQDFWLRLFSVLFGVATLPVTYLLGKQLFCARAGLWSAAFLSVMLLHIKHSQETRMYTLMVFLFAAALLALVRAARGDRRKDWWAYVVCAALLAYSHALGWMYVAVLTALFPFLTAGEVRRFQTWRPLLLATLTVVLAFLPWLPVYIFRAKAVIADYWITEIDPELVVTRGIWFAPILLVLAFTVLRARAGHRRAIWALVTACVLPIAVFLLAGYLIRPLFVLRYALPVLIPVVLLLGATDDVLPGRRALIHLLLGTMLCFFTTRSFTGLRQLKTEEWRDASKYLQTSVRPRDLLVLDTPIAGDKISTGFTLLERYDSGQRLAQVARLILPVGINPVIEQPDVSLDRAARSFPPGQVLWIIQSHPIHAQEQIIAQWLNAHVETNAQREFDGILVTRATVR